EHHEQGEQAEDRRVHRRPRVAPTPRGRLAWSEISSSRASSTKFARIEEPPYDTNGSVTPVSGMTRVTPPTITNTCSAITEVSPAASSFQTGWRAGAAVLNPRPANTRSTPISPHAPTSPSSFTITA